MDAVLHDKPDYVARAPAANEIERNRELPASIVSTLIDNGLFRLLQPRSLGGAELDPMTYVRVVEQIGSHDASTGWCIEQANGCSMAAAFLDPEVAQKSSDRQTASSPGAQSAEPNCVQSPAGFV